MQIGMIIRFHYEENDPRFEWRFKYFKESVLPKILKNKEKNDFDICIRCKDSHKKLFEDLGLKTFKVKKEYAKYKTHRRNKSKRFFHDFVKQEDCIGLEKYDLQLGLDSDDLIEDNYLQRILNELEILKSQNSNKSIHICFQPQMLDIKTGNITDFNQYHENRGSAFMALYQPNKDNYRHIYEESHISLIKRADIKSILPTGYCYASKHDLNESTGK